MKKYHIVILTLTLSLFFVSCAYYPYYPYYPPDRYHTQLGTVMGAGAGALIGQAIGGDAESTLAGLAAGTIFGFLVGNAIDQDYQAARVSAQYSRPVIYYDKTGHAVEAIPERTNDPNCQKVRKRIWENGKLIKETVEEICVPPAPVVYYYPAPPPPGYYWYPPYYYHRGWHR